MRTQETAARSWITPLFFAALTTAMFAQVASAEDSWNAFQNGGALTVSQANSPIKWSPTEGLAWQIKLAGYGQSSPVVDRHLIDVSSTSGEMKQHLHIEVIDQRAGTRVWRFDSQNSSPEEHTNYVPPMG